MKDKICFVFGDSANAHHYASAIDAVIENTKFLVVNTDIAILECLAQKNAEVTVYYTGKPQYTILGSVSGFKSNTERDAAMTNSSHYDIAISTTLDERGRIARNLKRRYAQIYKLLVDYRNNVLCRIESNQHKAGIVWDKLKPLITDEERYELTDYRTHYNMNQSNIKSFGNYLKELETKYGDNSAAIRNCIIV